MADLLLAGDEGRLQHLAALRFAAAAQQALGRAALKLVRDDFSLEFTELVVDRLRSAGVLQAFDSM